MDKTILKTNCITKKYGQSFALKNVSINVNTGDIYGLVGKNGAGKTTLLKILSGIETPTSGLQMLFGKSSEKELRKERRKTGCIIDTPNFFPYLTAEKNLEYYRIQRGIAGRSCIKDALESVELTDTGNKKFKDFSLGMKQRLGLALAIMGNPDILILDEPVNGLDPIGIVKMRELLKRLNSERNVTILISSHILGELSQLATNYGFIDNGELLEEATAVDIEEKCRLCLIIKANDTAKAVVILENRLDCHEYEVLDDSTIRVYRYVDQADMITRILVTNGVGITSISSKSTTLEEYFVNVIGGRKNA